MPQLICCAGIQVVRCDQGLDRTCCNDNDDDDTSDDGEDKQHNITSEYHLMAMVIESSCGLYRALSNSQVLTILGAVLADLSYVWK